MKVRFTSKVFLAVAFFFVLALAGCKMKEPSENDDEAADDVVPTNQKQPADTDKATVKLVEQSVADLSKVKDQPGAFVVTANTEQDFEQGLVKARIRAAKKYLKRYEAGQKVFILSAHLTDCMNDERVDCSDSLKRQLEEVSLVCEIADIDPVSGGYFVHFTGAGHYRNKTGVTATTALVVRVSGCGEKKTE